MAKEEKDNKSFQQKYLKHLDQTFVDAVEQMGSDDVKARVLTCEDNLYEIENAKEADGKLKDAKENVKKLSIAYTETKKVETAKLKFCLFTLQQRGIDLQ
jgi:hypothetical protein